MKLIIVFLLNILVWLAACAMLGTAMFLAYHHPKMEVGNFIGCGLLLSIIAAMLTGAIISNKDLK